MARASGLPARYRDRSPVLVSWWVLGVGTVLMTIAVGYLFEGRWWRAVALMAGAVVAGLVTAARAVRLARGEVMAGRAELLAAIRALPPADAWADRSRGVAYQLEARASGLPGVTAVYLAEVDLDAVVGTPTGGYRVTARQYGMLPWQPRVRVEIVEGPVPGGPGDGCPQPRRPTLAWVWHSWQVRRAGMLYAEVGEVRQLAARLADAKPAE